MRASTHQRIISLIGQEIGIKLRGATYADTKRKDHHPRYEDIRLNRHHDIAENRYRIKKLIFYAKQSYEEKPYPYNIWHSTEEFATAIHFLCDSAVPSLGKCNRVEQKRIEDAFDEVCIKSEWNKVPERRLTKSEVENLIDNLLDELPIYSTNKKSITNTMKNIYQTALTLAKFVFCETKRVYKKEDIRNLFENTYVAFPFKNHMRLLNNSSSLINKSHYLFSIRLIFGEERKGIGEFIKDAFVILDDKKYYFKKVKSTIYEKDEFYIFFKLDFLSGTEGSRKVNIFLLTVDDYPDFQKKIDIYYRKNEKGILLKMNNDERFIEDGYKDIFYDDFYEVHFPLIKENIKYKPPNIDFKLYDGIPCLDTNDLILPIWFQKTFQK